MTKQTTQWTEESRWGAGCAFVDYNRDGHLDLFVSNYIRFSWGPLLVPGESSTCNWKGIRVNCGPRGLPTRRHFLYRKNGDGNVYRFTGLGAGFADFIPTASVRRASVWAQRACCGPRCRLWNQPPLQIRFCVGLDATRVEHRSVSQRSFIRQLLAARGFHRVLGNGTDLSQRSPYRFGSV